MKRLGGGAQSSRSMSTRRSSRMTFKSRSGGPRRMNGRLFGFALSDTTRGLANTSRHFGMSQTPFHLSLMKTILSSAYLGMPPIPRRSIEATGMRSRPIRNSGRVLSLTQCTCLFTNNRGGRFSQTRKAKPFRGQVSGSPGVAILPRPISMATALSD